MAQLTTERSIDIDEFDQLPGETYMDHMRRAESVMDRLLAVSDSLPEGEIVGAIIHFPVADGQAYYRVQSESPLIVEHVTYLDAWQVDPIMIKGLDKEDVLAKLNRSKLSPRLKVI